MTGPRTRTVPWPGTLTIDLRDAKEADRDVWVNGADAVRMNMKIMIDTQMIEEFCLENEKDSQRLLGPNVSLRPLTRISLASPGVP